jgi:hypothetical protein
MDTKYRCRTGDRDDIPDASLVIKAESQDTRNNHPQWVLRDKAGVESRGWVAALLVAQNV